jgi:hypothetical protein
MYGGIGDILRDYGRGRKSDCVNQQGIGVRREIVWLPKLPGGLCLRERLRTIRGWLRVKITQTNAGSSELYPPSRESATTSLRCKRLVSKGLVPLVSELRFGGRPVGPNNPALFSRYFCVIAAFTPRHSSV